MDFNNSAKPMLTEPGVRYFLNQTLKQCHHIKNNYYNFLINFSLFFVFCIILGGMLLYKYKGKMTPQEKIQKEKEKQQYILSKIKQFEENKKRASQELITGLPSWDSEYDIIHNKFKY